MHVFSSLAFADLMISTLIRVAVVYFLQLLFAVGTMDIQFFAKPNRLVAALFCSMLISGCVTPQQHAGDAATNMKPLKIASSADNTHVAREANARTAILENEGSEFCKIFSSQEYCERYGYLLRTSSKFIIAPYVENQSYRELVRSFLGFPPDAHKLKTTTNKHAQARKSLLELFQVIGTAAPDSRLSAHSGKISKLDRYCWKPFRPSEKFRLTNDSTHANVNMLLFQSDIKKNCSKTLSAEKLEETNVKEGNLRFDHREKFVIVREIKVSSDSCTTSIVRDWELDCKLPFFPSSDFYYTIQCIQKNGGDGEAKFQLFSQKDTENQNDIIQGECSDIINGLYLAMKIRLDQINNSAPPQSIAGMNVGF